MNLLAYLESQPWAVALGWTLLHFVWQGALIAALAGATLGVMRDRTAQARYAVCCAALALLFLAPLVTFVTVAVQSPGPLPPLSPFLADSEPLPLWDRLAPVLPWLTLFWFVGTALFQARIFLHWTGAQRIKRRGIRPVPPGWQQTLGDLCLQLDIRRTVRLFESSLARVPMVMGWLSPVILVPAGVLTGLSPLEVKAVIAHELAHVRRHDYIINLVQALFEALLFYHPAVWWLSNRVRTEREYCCDDIAVNACRDALCYARALSSLDALSDAERGAVMASTGGSLMDRIFRLLGVRSKATSRHGGWLAPLFIAFFMTAAVSAMTLSQASTPDVDKTEATLKLPQDDAGKEGKYVVKGPVCLEDVKDLIKKLEAKGKSHAEIQKILDQYCLDTKKKAACEKAEQAKKTGRKPKSPCREIEKQLVEMTLKSKALDAGRVTLKKEMDMKIWQIQMSGKSETEVTGAIADLRKKRTQIEKDFDKKSQMVAEKRKDLTKIYVMELRNEGVPEEKIKLHLKKVDIMVREQELYALDEEKLIQKMKKMGKSKEEVKKALEERRKKAAKSDDGKLSKKKKGPPPGEPR
jgi:beta-lactamase regulating signal transducer with metallopeptidase domain